MSSLRIVIRSSRLISPRSAIWKAITSTGILITLALLKISPSRTPAVSPVVTCFTQIPARPGKPAAASARILCNGVGVCAIGPATAPATKTTNAMKVRTPDSL